MFSAFSNAECNHPTQKQYTYQTVINSAKYESATDRVLVNVGYTLTRGQTKDLGSCGGFNAINYAVLSASIGGVSSAEVKTNGLLPSSLNFYVSASSLDKTLLANGGYTITANGRNTSPNGTYAYFYYFTVGSKNTSIITDLAPSTYESTEYQTQSIQCVNPYIEGGNGISQQRLREIWSDGPRTWSAWNTIENVCYKNVSDKKDNNRKACGEGQTGYRITEFTRTHKEYSVDSGKTAAEIAALNEQNSTVWTEVEVINTCVNVPDKITTEQGSRILPCENIYGGKSSDYSGEIVESGTIIYSYSSITKQTTTSFVSNRPPTYNSTCQLTISDVTTETSTKACPVGYTGIVTSYRYVATDSKGNKTYPNGIEYIESSNDCVSTQSSTDDSNKMDSNSNSRGLLANNTIKSSSLLNKTELESFINNLDKTTVNKEENYKLYLIIDDLRKEKYNKENITKTITAYQNITGELPIITLPRSADKYIGYGEISETNYKSKIINNVLLNGKIATITYSEPSIGLKSSEKRTFNIILY